MVDRLLLAVVCLAASAGAAATGALSSLEAVRLGLERSYELRARRLDLARAEAAVRAAWQPYSPTLFATTTATRTPFEQSTPSQRLDATLGAGVKTIWGTQLSAQAEMDQALPGSVDPVHGSSLSLSVTQPLLKDGWAVGASLPLVEARAAAAIQAELYRAVRNAFIVELETAYWNLALAQAEVTVRTRSRERAQQQYEDTAENVKRGILAEAELYVVQENVVIFDQELIRARQDLVAARKRLAELLALETDEGLTAAEALGPLESALPQRAAAVEAALGAHPRVREQRLRVELARARRAYWANQTLPSLSLAGALALRGWDSQRDSAWGQLFASPGVDARVGLTFVLPLDRSAVRGSLERADVEVEQAEAERRRVENSVRYEVENAWTDLDSNERVLSLSRRQVELAELKLKAQVDKYQSGLSTLADVVRFQRDLDGASSASQRVVRSTRVGRARLLAATGTIAASAGVASD